MVTHVLVKTEKSRCPACGEETTLLQHRGGYGSMFFICFPCKRVFEAGRGEVTYEKD